ncbi:hypothetical protein KFL_006520080 [Klebsormidium nitens]|uniref:Uncharacterized protein n=1 Tax=Klebsormidium nitens TaxID=105231 RepID=A0A1Y1IK85_KLENI|nr:hypothetical protein KFL_006520080 [Klebsormidium nitens]|eukprot:GAQ90532.1 hypothetical protein KFL_006520080 [Klebsormidium nitens]
MIKEQEGSLVLEQQGASWSSLGATCCRSEHPLLNSPQHGALRSLRRAVRALKLQCGMRSYTSPPRNTCDEAALKRWHEEMTSRMDGQDIRIQLLEEQNRRLNVKVTFLQQVNEAKELELKDAIRTLCAMETPAAGLGLSQERTAAPFQDGKSDHVSADGTGGKGLDLRTLESLDFSVDVFQSTGCNSLPAEAILPSPVGVNSVGGESALSSGVGEPVLTSNLSDVLFGSMTSQTSRQAPPAWF